MKPIAVLRQHALDLAVAFDVRLIEVAEMKPEDAFGHAGERVVAVHPITEETLYAVALHEIGHLVDPLGVLGAEISHARSRRRQARLRYDRELAAWAWARHYALEWTPAMQAVSEWALTTYAPTPPTSPTPARPRQRIADVSTFTKSIKWEKPKP